MATRKPIICIPTREYAVDYEILTKLVCDETCNKEEYFLWYVLQTGTTELFDKWWNFVLTFREPPDQIEREVSAIPLIQSYWSEGYLDGGGIVGVPV